MLAQNAVNVAVIFFHLANVAAGATSSSIPIFARTHTRPRLPPSPRMHLDYRTRARGEPINARLRAPRLSDWFKSGRLAQLTATL